MSRRKRWVIYYTGVGMVGGDVKGRFWLRWTANREARRLRAAPGGGTFTLMSTREIARHARRWERLSAWVQRYGGRP